MYAALIAIGFVHVSEKSLPVIQWIEYTSPKRDGDSSNLSGKIVNWNHAGSKPVASFFVGT